MDPTQQVWEIKPPFLRTKFYVLFKFPGNPKGRGYLEKSPQIGGTCLCSFDLSSTGQQSNFNAFFVAADFGFLVFFFFTQENQFVEKSFAGNVGGKWTRASLSEKLRNQLKTECFWHAP